MADGSGDDAMAWTNVEGSRWRRLRALWRSVLALSWPVMTEQVSRTLMRTVDVFITALFSPAAVVAIGLAELYSQFALRIGLGLGGGAIALSSQETGREGGVGRDETIGTALLLGVLLGIPLALAGIFFGEAMIALLGASEEVIALGSVYLAIILATAPARHVMLIASRALQGTGDTRTPMYINIFANLLNVMGSLVLGLGLLGAPELRVVGVGIATATANVSSALLFFAVLSGPWAEAGVKQPRNPVIARQLIVVGAPKTAEGFAVALARFPFNALLLVFGTEVNAGYQIGRRIYQQVTAPLARGYKVAASIVVGQSLGRGNPGEARFGGWGIAALGVLSIGGIGVLLIVAADPIVRLFSDDPAAIGRSIDFVRTYALAGIPLVAFLSLSGALQGAGETRLPFLARATGVFGFMLGLAYLMGITLGYGPAGAYVGLGLAYVWMAAVVFWSFARSDWAGRAAQMMEERAEETE
jgi:putative MATE family efflux protein